MFQFSSIEHLNAFILANLNNLEFSAEDQIPSAPMEWLIQHFHGMEGGAILCIPAGLMMRGAEPADCARYVLDRSIPLPFIGFEQALYDTVIDGLLERGQSPESIARVLEIVAVLSNLALGRFTEMLASGSNIAEVARA